MFTWLAMVSNRDSSGVAAGGLSLVVGTATPRLGTEATDGGATLLDSLFKKKNNLNWMIEN